MTEWLFRKKIQAAQAARKVLSYPDLVIWDSETTGIGDRARFVQLAAIDVRGNVLLDTLINPQIPSSEKAVQVHGIDDEAVLSAPTFFEVFPALRSVLHRRRWAIYNASFDVGVLTNELSHLFIDWGRSTTIRFVQPLLGARETKQGMRSRYCAMKLYAQFYGEYSDYHGSFTWQKLVDAVDRLDIQIPAPPHSALGDAQRALAVLQSMSAWLDKPYLKELVS